VHWDKYAVHLFCLAPIWRRHCYSSWIMNQVELQNPRTAGILNDFCINFIFYRNVIWLITYQRDGSDDHQRSHRWPHGRLDWLQWSVTTSLSSTRSELFSSCRTCRHRLMPTVSSSVFHDDQRGRGLWELLECTIGAVYGDVHPSVSCRARRSGDACIASLSYTPLTHRSAIAQGKTLRLHTTACSPAAL